LAREIEVREGGDHSIWLCEWGCRDEDLPMDNEMAARIDFLMETEKLKSILRRTSPAFLERPENSAEHSWSLSIMAMLFADLADEPVALEKVLRLVAVHDLVEIHAGDTYCYDAAANADKARREEAAAEQLFGGLPDGQGAAFRGLWDEFEAGVTAEARFANALDRLLPLLQHRMHHGVIWKAHGITRDQVLRRIAPVATISVALYDYGCRVVEEAVARQWIAD
jgi:putative hydrolase of HD superfamily